MSMEQVAQVLAAIREDISHLRSKTDEFAIGQAALHRDLAVLGERLESERQRAIEANKAIRENAQRLAVIEAHHNKTDGALKATKILAGLGIVAGGGSLIERIAAFLADHGTP